LFTYDHLHELREPRCIYCRNTLICIVTCSQRTF
jgi:hypothetical protein